jgi:hypothetical protein
MDYVADSLFFKGASNFNVVVIGCFLVAVLWAYLRLTASVQKRIIDPKNAHVPLWVFLEGFIIQRLGISEGKFSRRMYVNPHLVLFAGSSRLIYIG